MSSPTGLPPPAPNYNTAPRADTLGLQAGPGGASSGVAARDVYQLGVDAQGINAEGATFSSADLAARVEGWISSGQYTREQLTAALAELRANGEFGGYGLAAAGAAEAYLRTV